MFSRALLAILQEAKELGLSIEEVPHTPSWMPMSPHMPRGRLLRAAPAIAAKLTKFLASEDQFSIFDGRNFLVGTDKKAVTLKALARSLLYSTSTIGAEETVNRLERFLGIDYVPSYEILIISGINVGSEVDLTDSIRLMPLDNIPDSPEKDMLLRFIERETSQQGAANPFFSRKLRATGLSALVRRFESRPKTVDNVTPVSEDRRFRDSLVEMCHVLTLGGRGIAPVPFISWYSVEEWVPCALHFASRAWSQPFQEFEFSQSKHILSDVEADVCKAVCRAFYATEAKDRDRLWIPIARIHQAKRRAYAVDQAIELGIALESLVLNDKHDELSFRLALLVAFHLGEDELQRREIYEKVRTFYSDCRSKAVHGGRLSDTVKVKLSGIKTKYSTDKLLLEIEHYSRALANKILLTGRWPTVDDLWK